MSGVKSEKRILERATKVTNIVLGGAGVVSLLVFFYIAYHYAFTGERQFTSPIGMIVYYVFPVLSAGLFLISLRMAPPHRINLSLLVIAFGISIYGVELFLAFSHTIPEYIRERQQVAKQFGATFDTRSKLEVLTDLRREGVPAHLALQPVGLLKEGNEELKSVITIEDAEVIPLAGISSKVTVLCNENGEYIIYDADEHGFSNPKGLWGSPHIDIAAVGDSFTHGHCVSPEKSLLGLIRKRYPLTINLGFGANGPLLTLATVKEYVTHLKPRVVLWVYYEGNDLADMQKTKRSPLLMRYLESEFSQGLIDRQPAIDLALSMYFETEKKRREIRSSQNTIAKRLGSFVKLANLREGLGIIYGRGKEGEYRMGGSGESQRASEADIRLFRDILLETKETVNVWAGKLYFVYLSDMTRYAAPELANRDRDGVLQLVADLGIPVIDIQPVFQAQPDPLALFPFRSFPHYTAEGYRLVAEEVLRSVSVQ